MFGYIYMTTNLINNRKYIGKRKWYDIDTINKDSYIGSGKVLKQAIVKYGRANFKKEVLCVCETEEELNYMEKFFIFKEDATHRAEFYNIAVGGEGGNVIEGLSQEEKQLIIEKTRLKNLGRVSPNKGKERTEEAKKKTSKTLKETWSDEERRKKWIASRYGRMHSEETRAKMSEKSYARYGTVPYDNNIIIYQYNKEKVLVNTFFGIDEYYNYFHTKTCRNLKDAVKTKCLFKNSYWKICSSSTIENTSLGERP